MKHVRSAVTAVGLALGVAVCAAPAASADEPVGQYTIDIKNMINYQITEWTLTCEPTGGDHPDPDAACADLAAADGDISAIPPLPDNCLPFHAPVSVIVVGTWAGRNYSWGGGFDSLCAASAASGGHVIE